MSVQFVIGRAGTGKSQFCINEISQELNENPIGNPLIMLVPEQVSFQMEHAIVTAPGLSGMMRSQVLSFRRLAFQIMQEAGGTTLSPIDDTGKKLLLYKLLKEEKNNLKCFHQSANQIGFLDELNDLFNEFKRYCLTSSNIEKYLHKFRDQLQHEDQTFEDKLHDIHLLYQQYEHVFNAQYIDAEDYLELLAIQIKDSEYMKQAEVWIDGFHGFTPLEYKILGQILQTAKKVKLTLTVDQEYQEQDQINELQLFHPTAKTMIELHKLIKEYGIEQEKTIILNDTERFKNNAPIAHLEQHYESGLKWKGENINNHIAICSAVHRRAEIEGAAREMIRLVREQGYRWRDFGVLIRNMEDYQDLISTIFSDYEIPYFIDQKREIMNHPLVEFIRSALEIVNFYWKYESVFRCIKTGFFQPIIQSDENELPFYTFDELENYVLSFGIQGSKWTDKTPWKFKVKSLEDEEQLTNKKEEAIYFTRLNQTRDLVVQPMLQFQKQIDQAKNIQEKVSALFELLESMNIYERLEQWSIESLEQGDVEQSKIHLQIWGNLMDVFDQLVEVIGEEEISNELFAELLNTGLGEIKMGLVPPSLDQVLIGNMERTRSSSIKYSFLLGVNDGVLPKKMNEDGMLTEHEREFLLETGIELAPNSRKKLMEEQFIIYTSLTISSEKLWVSYPIADEEGKTLIPSEVIYKIKRMFPELETNIIAADPSGLTELEQIASFFEHPERVLSYLIVQLQQLKNGHEISDVWHKVYQWFYSQDTWRGKLEKLCYGVFFSNQEPPLSPETGMKIYGDKLYSSVSRMEKFISCPYAHFVSYGLRLKERKIYRLEAPDIGQLFHAALKLISEQLLESKMQWSDLSKDDCIKRAEQTVEQLSPKLQSEILFSSKRYLYITKKLTNIISRAALILSEHAKRSEFEPVGFEVDFGMNGTLPPLKLQLAQGIEMEVKGRIDRVDRANSEDGTLLRVIDYKSSEKALNLSEVFYGLSLQMLTYLDVIITHSEKWLGEQAMPAGVLYFHVQNPMLNLSNQLTPEQAAEQIFRRFKMKGLLLANENIVKKMDIQLDSGHSNVIPVAIKSKGGFYKTSSVVEEEQWEQLRGYTRQMMVNVGSEIMNGNVDIKPYRMSKKTACTFCEYKSICQFNTLYEENDYRDLQSKSNEEVLATMNQSEESDGE
ncbi:helicase-exonuclease AddAB subunit AddB [Chengkuizengella axinellae]|uniref:ATP-dependent helicase/deoxyribonuclease subunit B n=1 Tax=Chengkuizengella axinellae TaxID=3064388 RepID=A0ABT9IUR0_9BACL|nr:helicase-exonuclease AddAB subunit AddB [Chengkuizengella sp. 2205SS18-9]MDP5273080.1 helicase-exonuclease AddAB subunit AddB [Chengkuizengella sp. 2205SS18-9]